MFGAIRSCGIVSYQKFEGATNSSLLEIFIHEKLAPNIRSNDLLIMNTVRIHHADIVKRTLEGYRILFWLVFSK